ncbi:multinuclear nonheme iron-dependent oxidase [Streptomyces californicus]|uniref:multinuclear nonheme iron-dependent oxidase n=1 Tax=Streptomyces californicus TaxID=67351 RepID=UPI0035E185A6
MELGIGIGWRPEIAHEVEALAGIDWVEAVAENLCADHLPDSLVRLRERGVTVVPHGVALGLGGADRPDPGRLAALAARAELLGAPLVTEHIAFVRAGGPLTASPGLEAGHLLPVPRTWDALDVLCENVRVAQDSLPVPLALENIAALITWPDEELTEGQFLAELVERTGVRLLIDVANLHTNHVNLGQDPAKALDELPVEAIAYVHVAGGVEKNGVWHDTHAHPVTAPVLEVLAELRSRVDPPGVLLERDDAFPPARELAGELDAIRATLRKAAPPAGSQAPVGSPARTVTVPAAPAPAPPVSAPPTPAPSVSAPSVSAPTVSAPPAPASSVSDAARDRTAVAQTALLSALVAGTPAPAGFDPARLRVQSRSLAAKRADVIAKVAPELPEILGDGYRAAFLAYAGDRPMSGGYRRDALDFAEHVLIAGGPADPVARRELTYWWRDRSGSRPPGRATRLIRAARAALVGR